MRPKRTGGHYWGTSFWHSATGLFPLSPLLPQVLLLLLPMVAALSQVCVLHPTQIEPPSLLGGCHGREGQARVGSRCSFQLPQLEQYSQFIKRMVPKEGKQGERQVVLTHFWKEYKPIMPFSWEIWQYISKTLNVYITFDLATLCIEISRQRLKRYMYKDVP